MGEVTDLPVAQTKAQKRQQAELEKAKLLASVAGGKQRAELLPRELLKILGFAVANQMLLEILNGRLKVRTVTEASQVARIALEMGRLEMGDSAVAEPVTADERKARIKEAKLLLDEIGKRKEILEAQVAADPGANAPAESPVADTA